MYDSIIILQHLFSSGNVEEIRKRMKEFANYYIGISIKYLKTTITMDEFTSQRFGKFR